MRTMYDSVDPSKVPMGADIVASYVNGPYAGGYEQAVKLFPKAMHLGISVNPRLNQGQALDIESGDARPEQAPSWVMLRRAAGVEPWCYMSLSVWDDVRNAMDNAGISHPQYWVAHWNGKRDIPDGAIACQYDHDLGHPAYNYDISAVVSTGIVGFDSTAHPVSKPTAIKPADKYVVKQGDSLSSISDHFYGSPNDWRNIYNANRRVIGDNPNVIKPGQYLVIPHIGKAATSHGRTYVVKLGDTLSSIADAFYNNPNKWHAIYSANRRVIGSDPDVIKPGQHLTIP